MNLISEFLAIVILAAGPANIRTMELHMQVLLQHQLRAQILLQDSASSQLTQTLQMDMVIAILKMSSIMAAAIATQTAEIVTS